MLRVDNSMLESTSACHTQAALRYVLHYTSPVESVYLFSGSAAHATLEKFFGTYAESTTDGVGTKPNGTVVGATTHDSSPNAEATVSDGGPPPRDGANSTTGLRAGIGQQTGAELSGGVDRALDHFDSFYKDWAQSNSHNWKDRQQETYSWGNLRRILQAWMEDFSKRSMPFKVLHVEKSFEVPLTEDIHLTGLLDLIVEYPDAQSSIVAVDHKTTGRPDLEWKRKLQMGTQFPGYRWALTQLYPDRFVPRTIVNGIHFKRVAGSSRKCPEHGVHYTECGILHLDHQWFHVEYYSHLEEAWKRWALTTAQTFGYLKENVKNVTDIKRLNILDQGKANGACYRCDFFDFCFSGRRPDVADRMFIQEEWDPTTKGEKLTPP
jgi:hypothetical protein